MITQSATPRLSFQTAFCRIRCDSTNELGSLPRSLRVAKHVLDLLEGNAVAEEARRGGVPQCMNVQLHALRVETINPSGFEHTVEDPHRAVRRVRPGAALGAHEDPIVGADGATEN